MRTLIFFFLVTVSCAFLHAEPQPESAYSARNITGKMAAVDAEVAQVLNASDFVEFSGMDSFPPAVKWDINSGKFLYLPKDSKKPSFVFLLGSIEEGHELNVDGAWISSVNGRFSAKVYLPSQPRLITVKIFDKKRNFSSYRFAYFWKRPLVMTPTRGIAMEKEKGARPVPRLTEGAFAQLYEGAQPTSLVDLDAIRHQALSFRLHRPPREGSEIESWSFEILTAQGVTVGQIGNNSELPEYLLWKDVAQNIVSAGTYLYKLTVTEKGNTVEGKFGTFEAIEGLSLLHHRSSPSVVFEPREELGYVAYQDTQVNFAIPYVGADLSWAFNDRFIIRGTGLVTLHSLEPQELFTYTRLGVGMRFFGQNTATWFGDPFIYRLDVLLNTSSYTLRPNSTQNRISQPSLLIEPHLVLGGYHYIVPTFEFGLGPDFTPERATIGINYFFFVRPWSMKFGIGIASDQIVKDSVQYMKFSTLRGLTSFVFTL